MSLYKMKQAAVGKSPTVCIRKNPPSQLDTLVDIWLKCCKFAELRYFSQSARVVCSVSYIRQNLQHSATNLLKFMTQYLHMIQKILTFITQSTHIYDQSSNHYH